MNVALVPVTLAMYFVLRHQMHAGPDALNFANALFVINAVLAVAPFPAYPLDGGQILLRVAVVRDGGGQQPLCRRRHRDRGVRSAFCAAASGWGVYMAFVAVFMGWQSIIGLSSRPCR